MRSCSSEQREKTGLYACAPHTACPANAGLTGFRDGGTAKSLMPCFLCPASSRLSSMSAASTCSSVNGSTCPPSQSSLHLELRVMCHMHLHLVCQSVPHPGQTLAMTNRLTSFRFPWACTWWIFRLAALANHFAHAPQMKPSSSELSGPSCLAAFARHLYFTGSSRTFFLKILAGVAVPSRATTHRPCNDAQSPIATERSWAYGDKA